DEVTEDIDGSEEDEEEIDVIERIGQYQVIATHEDIDDEGQTVGVTNPNIGTKATHKPTDLQDILPFEIVTIQDEVMYEDLIPGKEYTVKGVLMNKETGEPLLVEPFEVEETTENEEDVEDEIEDVENSEEVENLEESSTEDVDIENVDTVEAEK